MILRYIGFLAKVLTNLSDIFEVYGKRELSDYFRKRSIYTKALTRVQRELIRVF